MSHGLKALLLAASTIITCIIVGLGFMMAREAKQIGNHVVEELYRYRVTIEDQDYTKYDGAVVYGNDVVNLMKKEFADEKGDVSVTVETGSIRYTYQEPRDIKKVQEPETVHYIVPTAEYVGSIVRNQNGVIVELIFRKVTEDKKNE